VKAELEAGALHTVCTEARCPNVGECFRGGTATFLIMGKTCTRACRYCAVSQGKPLSADPGEPGRVARAVRNMGLRHAVVTSVTRDDLPDGGAGVFALTAREIREAAPGCGVELLVPDFGPVMESSMELVVRSVPDVINHNIEVVRGLFLGLRPQGDYALSLRLLRLAASSGIPAKSGLMVGFGEDMDGIRATLGDLLETGCRSLTVGQYLQSRRDGHPVVKYYHPEEFDGIGAMARSMGFTAVMSGPLVRSSYHAAGMAEGACRDNVNA
jgi:lipoic acid synthetase